MLLIEIETSDTGARWQDDDAASCRPRRRAVACEVFVSDNGTNEWLVRAFL
ncbi:hypothetical protein [Haladaptatus sp. W1]|uniref:hypothetical protein n=1 Tax=Haladaptatus sp. W1 TaxID=1897478 RepID=UPI0015863437|nr:hypothetical protein [Haladaptatus sp. W1]